jgi:hypothetical protein
LGAIQPFRRAGERAFFDDGEEMFEVEEIHTGLTFC